MNDVTINLKIHQHEVPDLRESVGWERRDKDYPCLLQRVLFWAGARSNSGQLIAFGYVTGPGIEHGYLDDIIVHPCHQRTGIGMKLVRGLLNEAKKQEISIITVTFSPEHEPFYVKCGFNTSRAGIWLRNI